jgi:hypothetical protein
MFKFNFFPENKEEKEVIEDDNESADDIKESKCIEVTKKQYTEYTENLSTEKFEIFVSNDVEFGYISNLSTNDDKESDLISGEYEGGFKIWECTYDIADYFTSSQENIFQDKNVCDLGCSAGLMGLLALSRESKIVHFQDYVSKEYSI